MDLDLSEEQEMLREAVRDLCAQHATPEVVRAFEDDPTGYPEGLWRELAAMDLLGLAVPEAHGGSGMGAVEQVVVAEELGRSLAPTPYLHTAVFGARILELAGRGDWLARVARGDAVVTLAWMEPHRGDGPDGVQLTAKPDGDDLVLSGTKIAVPFASAADAVVTLARTGDEVGVVLVDPASPGVGLERAPTLASDASYEVTFDGVRVPAPERLGDWTTFATALDDALVAVAATAVGGAERVLEMSVGYAKERVQFGVPIGNFQGVAHPLADIATEVAGARVLTYEAAWRRGTGRDLGPLAAMAKQYACDVYRRATRVAHQTYGGIGFTLAVDVQLYFRRAKQLEVTWSEPRTLLERVAAAELDADDPWVTFAPAR